MTQAKLLPQRYLPNYGGDFNKINNRTNVYMLMLGGGRLSCQLRRKRVVAWLLRRQNSLKLFLQGAILFRPPGDTGILEDICAGRYHLSSASSSLSQAILPMSSRNRQCQFHFTTGEKWESKRLISDFSKVTQQSRVSKPVFFARCSKWLQRSHPGPPTKQLH